MSNVCLLFSNVWQPAQTNSTLQMFDIGVSWCRVVLPERSAATRT
jgi:hypothetical protein